MTASPWDCQWVVPRVREYLEYFRYPAVLGDTRVEDWIRSLHPLPPGLTHTRYRHCIARGLSRYGYRRRSHRGKTWDLVAPPPIAGAER